MTQAATTTARERAIEAPPAIRERAVEKPAATRRNGGLRRFVLIVVIPAIAVAGALDWWLSTGRYVSTDNAFIGADKTMVTPYVTGPIVTIHVKEGQAVKLGDPLFDIDPAPYETALALARGRLEAAKVEFANLKTQYASNIDQIRMGEDAVRLHQADFDRKQKLLATSSGTQANEDTSQMALVQAQQILEFSRSLQESVKIKLGGGPDTSIETFPDYMQAKAAVDDAERNLGYTHITAKSPASRRKCRRSSSAASRRRDSRCSPSSPIKAFGSTPIPRSSNDLRHGGTAGECDDRRVSRTATGAGRSARLRRAPARSLRSCRRRMPAATGSKSFSACRSGSASRPMWTPRAYAPA